MRHTYRRLMLLAAAGLAMLVVACQPPPPAATPTATRTPGIVINAPTPTAQTGAQPAATRPAPTAPPALAAPIGPDSYPQGVNPLTGLPVADPAVLSRRPLAIKVSNHVNVNPQSGLGAADWVWEHYAEGGETRYTAVYYSQTPERVGSVRSGRLIDLEIVPMTDAFFASSGFSGGTLARVDASNWANRNFSGPFYGDPYLVRIPQPNRDPEHTLFAVPARLWELATQQGVNQTPDLTPGLVFSQTPNSGGAPASSFRIDFGLSYTEVSWAYDAATGLYMRSLAGDPHLDALNSQQISAANVMLVGAMHVKADYIEDGTTGELSTEIQIWGEGPATLFRDGQRLEGRWTRLVPEDMLAFTDLNGSVLTFRPGQTWFEIVPIGFDQLFVEP